MACTVYIIPRSEQPTLNSTFSITLGSRRVTRVRHQLSRTCHGEGWQSSICMRESTACLRLSFTNYSFACKTRRGSEMVRVFFPQHWHCAMPCSMVMERKVEPFFCCAGLMQADGFVLITGVIPQCEFGDVCNVTIGMQ